MTHTSFFYRLAVLCSRWSAFFAKARHLHTARFANLHEVSHLFSPTLERLHTSILLGTAAFAHFVCIRPTPKRRELGNLLICAPPRSGKSVLAISQLLTWQHSAIVNDIKGELYQATAGYRATLGPVYVIDPVAGVGHRFDPFAGRTTERQLATLAHHLLFDPQDREPIFVQRAEKMLTQMTRAARMAQEGGERSGLLPYIGSLITGGPKYTAEYLTFPLCCFNKISC